MSNISGYFETGNENGTRFYEEYEIMMRKWYFRFNFNKSSISNGHLFDKIKMVGLMQI